MSIEYKSQFGQDKWVAETLFRGMTHGFYVDIGAGNGELISNTWVLEKHYKWDGICIDPADFTWADLQKNRRCRMDNVVVSDFDGEIDFNEPFGHEHSSLFSSVFTPHSDHPKYTTKKKKCESLYTVLNRLRSCTLIHYLSIDTEGMEYTILKKFFEDEYIHDKQGWKRRIICIGVEHNFNEEYRAKLRELLTEYHYTYITTLGVDDMYVHTIYDVLCS